VLPTLLDTSLLPGLFVLICVLALFIHFVKIKKSREFIFGIGWFLLLLAVAHQAQQPVSSRFHVASHLSAARRTSYSSVIGRFAESAKKNNDHCHSIHVFFSDIKAIPLPIIFGDGITFWTNVCETSPRYPVAHFNLAVSYYQAGVIDSARAHFIKSLEQNSSDVAACVNLGTIAMEKNNYEESEIWLKRAMEMKPDYAYAFISGAC